MDRAELQADQQQSFIAECHRGTPPEEAAEKIGVPYGLFLARSDTDPELAFLKLEDIQSAKAITLRASKKVTVRRSKDPLPKDSLGYKYDQLKRIVKNGFHEDVDFYQNRCSELMRTPDVPGEYDPYVEKRQRRGEEMMEMLFSKLWVPLMPKEQATRIERSIASETTEVSEVLIELSNVEAEIQQEIHKNAEAKGMRKNLAKGKDDGQNGTTTGPEVGAEEADSLGAED